MITHKNTIEKAAEIDPEAAEWTQRGAEMIAYEGRSAINVARLFNEHKVGGKQTWSDGRVRHHFGREKLVGKDVFRKTKQVIDRQLAAQVLKALVGDVVIQKQHVDGYENPQMIARFTINAVLALAVLDRRSGASDGDSVWPHLQSAHPAKAGRRSLGGDVTGTLAYKPGGSQRRTEDDGV